MHVPFVEFQDVLRSNVVMGIAIKCLRTSCGVGVVGVGGDFDVRRGGREVVWNRVEDTACAAIAWLGPWYWGKARQHGKEPRKEKGGK
jgi:hypothetical protein